MKPSEHSPQLACMMVEMDAIFDTRLGTIAKFGNDAYRVALGMGYTTRMSDHFEGIDPEKYRELYENRDAETLSGSMITQIVSLIKDFVTRVNITSASSPVKKTPRIEINTYPYDPPERVMDLIIKALRTHIQDRVDIVHVRYSFEDLHYDIVKLTYDHLVMYDIGPWVEAQAQDWQRRDRGLPDVTVFFPMLHRAKDKSEVPADISELADVLNRCLSPILNPMQIPIQFFCSALDPMMLTEAPEAEAPSASEDSQ